MEKLAAAQQENKEEVVCGVQTMPVNRAITRLRLIMKKYGTLDVPLPDEFLDVAVFSLSLMGANITDYLNEAYRCLKAGGKLYIAESTARFSNIKQFVENLRKIGFEVYYERRRSINRRLSRSIADLGLFELRRQLNYKGVWYLCQIVPIDRFFPSSKTCSVCGEINESLTLTDREWTCEGCGTKHDRDHNASVNLENAALQFVGG